MRDYALGTTFDLKFTTRQFSSGAPFSLSGGTIAAYPDNSTTEITAGITLTADFDARTGLNNVRVVATGGNGYAAGSNYSLVITAGTVDGVSVVGEVIGEFSIEAQSPLRPTTAGRTLDVTATGGAGVDWANVENQGTAVNLSATNIDPDQVVASVGSVTAPVAITSNIKQNQALAAFEFLMTDSATHAPATGLTVTVTRSIDGGAFAAGTLSAVTEVSNGVYLVDFRAADLNGKVITLQATAAGADTTFERIVTQV